MRSRAFGKEYVLRNIADILKEQGNESSEKEETTLNIPITFNSKVTGINRLIRKRNKLVHKRDKIIEKVNCLETKIRDLDLSISIIEKILEG